MKNANSFVCCRIGARHRVGRSRNDRTAAALRKHDSEPQHSPARNNRPAAHTDSPKVPKNPAHAYAKVVPLDRSPLLPTSYLSRTLTACVGQRFGCELEAGADRIAEHHYNLGNDLFQAMLDPRMTYSCGYWEHATTLADAPEAKLDLVCRKLNLKPGQTVLDIGCGWGSFVKYAVEKYDVTAVGVTVSKEQVALGRELCAGLPVELRLQDYREVVDPFDHVVSIGMFEHVGPKNYRASFDVAHRCLKGDGRFLLHTIGKNSTGRPVDAWLEKYIFPNSAQPAIGEIAAAIEGLFVVEDWQNFGADYDPTLMAWFANFDNAWNRLRAHYDDTFYRMWQYFLLSCAGSFRARHNNVWQVLLSKRGVPGGYRRIELRDRKA